MATKAESLLLSFRKRIENTSTTTKSELYNFSNDPTEQSNIVSVYPKLAETLKAKLEKWLASVNATYPYTNPNYDAIPN